MINQDFIDDLVHITRGFGKLLAIKSIYLDKNLNYVINEKVFIKQFDVYKEMSDFRHLGDKAVYFAIAKCWRDYWYGVDSEWYFFISTM